MVKLLTVFVAKLVEIITSTTDWVWFFHTFGTFLNLRASEMGEILKKSKCQISIILSADEDIIQFACIHSLVCHVM